MGESVACKKVPPEVAKLMGLKKDQDAHLLHITQT